MTADGSEQGSELEPGGGAASETPAFHRDTDLLIWDRDAQSLDDDDYLEAQGDDWRYIIHPLHGPDGRTVGYRISGGDNDSSEEIGSSIIDGKKGELTLPKAKAAAEANYASRYREAEQFLDELLDGWEDEMAFRLPSKRQRLHGVPGKPTGHRRG